MNRTCANCGWNTSDDEIVECANSWIILEEHCSISLHWKPQKKMRMDKKTFDDRLSQINLERKSKLSQLRLEYALSNNLYSIGDIIFDGVDTIKIDKLQYTKLMYSEYSECVYSGVKLTKKLIPFKDGCKSKIYQHNIIEVNDEQGTSK